MTGIPRVAPASQPWAGGRNPVGVDRVFGPGNPGGLVPCDNGLPRVVRGSQPWAGGRNPVGVGRGISPSGSVVVIGGNAKCNGNIII